MYYTVSGGKTKNAYLNVGFSPNVFTIPTHVSQSILVNEEIKSLQYRTRQVTITPTSGVTIRSRTGMVKIYTQHSGIYLTKLFDNELLLYRDLTT